jgi:hypothetical protein
MEPQKSGINPALSGVIVLTTVTDIIGFLSFLGLARVLLFKTLGQMMVDCGNTNRLCSNCLNRDKALL